MNKERKICGIKVIVSGETYNEYKGTLEEQLQEKDKEISRLNKKYENAVADYEEQKYIISELEKYLEKTIIDGGTRGSMTFWYRQIYEYLKELKEGK